MGTTCDWRIALAGDAAVTIEFPARIDPCISERVVTLACRIRAARYPGVRDVVPGYHAATVYFEPTRTDLNLLWAALDQAAADPTPALATTRDVVVPVVYGGAGGPDLDDVAAFAGCTPEEVVRRHASVWYRVYMVGFLAGFPYMGSVDARIAMPRRETPRLAVPAGSVGIAGAQTGIYPMTAPGGWRLIGRAAVEPFDPDRDPPSLCRPGDRVRFEALAVEE